nr:hypothetical protein [Armatimonas sp.]
MPELRLLPVPRTAVFRDENYYIWCGSMIRTDDGTCHLFYSRWPRKLGHYAWVTHSEIAHAVADSPDGPWKRLDKPVVDVPPGFHDALMTSNPVEIR